MTIAMLTSQDIGTSRNGMMELPLLSGLGSSTVSTDTTAVTSVGIPDPTFDIETWKGGGIKRYLVDDLIQPVKKGKKIEEELTYKNINDCRYWAIHFLEKNTFDPNQESPEQFEKDRAARWLKSLRRQLTKVFVEESRFEYFKQSNDLKNWGKLSGGEGFQSYLDLQRATKDMTCEMVRFIS